ncbi:MAG: FkbM family methyltransferase [Alphaproteobacteria bacterium]|nr:FkbM family methyltransferase [Alphaproteobacteria bacterium]
MAAPPSIFAILDLPVAIKVVDIGANPIDGEPPYAPLLKAGRAEVVGFEPNLQAHAVLQQKKEPRETYLPLAIGDGKRHTLHHCHAPGMTSLLEPNPDVLALFHGFPDWGRVVRTEAVDTVRLDDVAETAGLDLLKIDIQGAELMVFENAPRRLAEALVIQTEVEFLEMYRGQPLYGDVERFLRAQGFMLHRFEPLVSRVVKPLVLGGDIFAGFTQLFWADAIFVRDLTRLGGLDDGQLLRAAAILHECYKAVDLALHILLEHDRRAGTALGPRYLQAITARA